MSARRPRPRWATAPPAWASGLALAMALAGCAAPPRAGSVDDRGLSGRLSVRVDETSTEAARSLSAGFELRGDAEQGSLALSTPLGTMLAQARWSPQQVVLVTPSGEAHFADLPALTREMLGQELPVGALFDWLRGRPWPGAESYPPERPVGSGFEQLGWQVTLDGLDSGLIVAQRLQAPRVTVRARLDPS